MNGDDHAAMVGPIVSAATARLAEKLQQAEADAKASEMMLKQVCEERDNLRRRVAEAEGKWTGELMKNTDHEKSASVLQSFHQIEMTKLRELLALCPLLHTVNEERVGVVFPSALADGGALFQQEGIRWIEKAKQEALKL